jgi:hypothetical protein
MVRFAALRGPAPGAPLVQVCRLTPTRFHALLPALHRLLALFRPSPPPMKMWPRRRAVTCLARPMPCNGARPQPGSLLRRAGCAHCWRGHAAAAPCAQGGCLHAARRPAETSVELRCPGGACVRARPPWCEGCFPGQRSGQQRVNDPVDADSNIPPLGQHPPRQPPAPTRFWSPAC